MKIRKIPKIKLRHVLILPFFTKFILRTLGKLIKIIYLDGNYKDLFTDLQHLMILKKLIF